MIGSSERGFTVAVLADIHGNLAALDAVLADLASQPHDTVVVDLTHNGPQPAEVLQRIRELDAPTLLGNGDCDVAQAQPGEILSWWTHQHLTPDDITYLACLPLTHRITPHGSSPDDDLLIMHATPHDCVATVILQPPPAGITLLDATPAAEAPALLGNERANLMIFGHIHYPSAGMVGRQRLDRLRRISLRRRPAGSLCSGRLGWHDLDRPAPAHCL